MEKDNAHGEREIAELRQRLNGFEAALRLFVSCAYPVATEINPRGYNWRGEDDLDEALAEARGALKSMNGKAMKPSEEQHLEELKLIDHTVSEINACADKRDWRAVHSKLHNFRNYIKSVLDAY